MLSLHIDLGAILTNIRNNIHCIIQVDWIKCLDLINALINSKFNSLLPSNLDPLTAFCSGVGGGGIELGVGAKKHKLLSVPGGVGGGGDKEAKSGLWMRGCNLWQSFFWGIWTRESTLIFYSRNVNGRW